MRFRIINREKLSRCIMREILNSVDAVVLSYSDSGKYILAHDGDDYFVLEEKSPDKYWFMCGRFILNSNEEFHFNKFTWNEEVGIVSLCCDFHRRRSFDIVYDYDLYARTVRPFRKKAESLAHEKENESEELFCRCSIQNHTLNFPLPEKIERLLDKNFKRTLNDGVFRFYEYSELERNAAEFLDANKDTKSAYGFIFSPRHLYEIICEAHGVSKNDSVKFNLVFSTDKDCVLVMNTTTDESR